MWSLFDPAITLMNRLRYAQKFLLLGLLALVAIASLQLSLFGALDRVIAPSRAELRGVEVIVRLNRAIRLLQQHRSVSAGMLGGRPELGAELGIKATEVRAAFDALDAALPPSLAQGPAWKALRGEWDSISREGASWPLDSNIARHDQLIAGLLPLHVEIADTTALTLDPDFASAYLIDALRQLPASTEQLARTSASGAVIMSSKTVNSLEKTAMAELLGRVQLTRDLHRGSLEKVMAYNPPLRERLARTDQQFELDMRAALDVVRKDLIGARFWTESAQYIALFSRLIDQSYAMGDEILAPALRAHLEQRIAAARRSLAWNGAVSLVVVGLFAYCALGAYLSLSGQIRQVLAALLALVDDSSARAELVETIAAGDLSREVAEPPPLALAPVALQHDEIGALLGAMQRLNQAQQSLGRGFVRMTQTLRQHRDEERNADWFKSGLNAINVEMRGDRHLEQMTRAAIACLSGHVQAAVGALYLLDGEQRLRLAASHALTPGTTPRASIALGEGLAGAAALARASMQLAVPPDYLPIASALGQGTPATVLAVPLVHDGALLGLVEVGAFAPFNPLQVAWLEQVGEVMAIALGVAQARCRVNELLEQTQSQAEELRVQQEELQQSNEELEERAELLEQQRELIRQKNQESEAASRELQRRADELQRTSTYKSEFLANMSHELRTPLNSMLILSSLLHQNKEGRLTPKQVEYAGTIHGAGKDLLNLINDILDLSKIEAGQVTLHIEEVELSELMEQLRTLFQPIAEHQGLQFGMVMQEGTPAVMRADGQRVRQILKNLLANAFKFTAAGQVSLTIGSAPADGKAAPALVFAVADSGIGIRADKQEQVFQAFQQADGSTSRKYGGTGLGLSISRQLARSMGGDILLDSAPDAGSVFSLHLPLYLAGGAVPMVARALPVPADARVDRRPEPAAGAEAEPERDAPALAPARAELPAMTVEDDRERLADGARAILIIEDDLAFARILRDRVREYGFLALVACDGEGGLVLAERYAPSAIILDVMLPHIDGWGVMRSIKDNPRTRHIPVHFITCLEDRQKALAMGAIGFATKPVSAEKLEQVLGAIGAAIDKTVRKLLVVEDDETEAMSVAALLAMSGLEISIAATGRAALERLAAEDYDCMVLDLGLADMSGFDLLDALAQRGGAAQMPVIVHSGRDLSEADERRLRRYADSIIIKGARSPERLLAEVSLFLHLVESKLAPAQQSMIRHALDKEASFERRTVLLVDDDIRNVYALSAVLAEKGMHIVEAANGVEALEQLALHAEVDIVLMDIMMPEMDGLEAMRRIRQQPRWERLPIIGLTAKAMVGDQKLCLDAGASDYLSKPVNLEQLFSLMRVWLYQDGGVAA